MLPIGGAMFQLNQNKFPVCLAPMVGLTHVSLRRLILSYMPQNASTHWPTEMLNSRRLPNENLQKTPETLRHSSESFLVPQILGNEEKAISLSVQRLVNEWGASGIDINMGCPVQKALKHNYGVSLMGDVEYAANVVRMTKRHSTVPVSVKLRAVGSSKSVVQLIDFVSRLVDAGADWITLHPRTAEQQRRGQADWSQIAALKQALKVPVIGNGDVQVAEDVFQMLSKTGADKVMVGRALAARPWLMWQVGERMGLAAPADQIRRNSVLVDGCGLRAPAGELAEGAEYGKALLKLIDFCEEDFVFGAGCSESLALRKMFFYIKTTHVWLEFGHSLMALSSRAKTLQELRASVHRFFETPQRMFAKTELRQ